MFRPLASLLPVLALVLTGCAATPEDTRPESAHVAELAAAIRALGPDVDPEEAQRAAQVSYDQAAHLKQVYEITDPPIIHNAKVNMGLKPRGLCWHWAEDMETRLAQEDFQTLDLHRAIANSFKAFRIDHSTVIVSAKGDDMFEGIVLDPWRKGGELTWLPTLDDPDYDWAPRREVFERKRQRQRDERLAQGNLFRPAISTSE